MVAAIVGLIDVDSVWVAAFGVPVETVMLLGLYDCFSVVSIDGEFDGATVGVIVLLVRLNDGVAEEIVAVDGEDDEGASEYAVILMISTDGASVAAINGDEGNECKDGVVLGTKVVVSVSAINGVEEGCPIVVLVLGFSDRDSDDSVDG
jgi:hypothetical protein